jgi:hypothetical protein
VALNLALTLVKETLQDPGRGAGHQHHFHRHAGGDDDDDQGGDFLPMAHKLEFTKFDGAGVPLPWLNRCERYFKVRRTSDHKQVTYASFHLLDDAQLWYHWS